MSSMLTVLLAKVFGLYLLVVGLAVFLNSRHIILAIMALPKERLAQLMAGTIALLLGLVLVNVHSDWSTTPAAVISFLGWLILAKGVFYLFVPEGVVTKFVKVFSDRSWYVIDGAVAIIAGIYLAGFGFGWF